MIFKMTKEGQIFDLFHILYIILSIAITVLLLVVPNKIFKTQKSKDRYLKFWGITTVFLHISPLWVDFLQGKLPIASDNMLFPIYFCNFAMYLLLITSFLGDKNSNKFKKIAVITAYSGILGASISLIYPDYYIGTQFNYGVFKSMLSHSTMLIGALYLITGKYFKVETSNTKTFSIGLLGFGVVGLTVILIYKIAGLPIPNAMYMIGPALETNNKVISVLLSGYSIGLALIGVVYLFTMIYEKASLKKVVSRKIKSYN